MQASERDVAAARRLVLHGVTGSGKSTLARALAGGRGVPRLESGRRTIRRVRTREQVCNGNEESWRGVVSADSIILWHFRSFASKRARARAWLADPDSPPVLLLRSATEVAAFAARMGAAGVRPQRPRARAPAPRARRGGRGRRAR